MSHFWINLFFYLQNSHLDKQMHSHLLQGIWQKLYSKELICSFFKGKLTAYFYFYLFLYKNRVDYILSYSKNPL